MRILSVAWAIYDEEIPEFSDHFTGAGIVVRDICSSLGKRAQSFLLLGRSQTEGKKRNHFEIVDTKSKSMDELKESGIVRSLDRKEMRLEAMTYYFEKAVKDLKPDIINFHGPGRFMQRCIKICEKYTIPVVVTVHLYVGRQKVFGWTEEELEVQDEIFLNDHVNLSVVSSGMKNNIVRDYPLLQPDKIQVILNGTDFIKATEPEEIRRRFGIEKRNKILLCVGTVCERKNQQQVVRSFSLLPEAVKGKITVLFFGKDKMQGALQKLIIEHDLEDNIKYAGMLPSNEMRKIYRSADGLIMPSFAEGLSIASLEAVASGLPVVMYADSECAADLNDEKVVCLVQERKDESLADAIVKWYHMSWDRQYIEMYSKKFSLENMADQYIAYYKSLISCKKATEQTGDFV